MSSGMPKRKKDKKKPKPKPGDLDPELLIKTAKAYTPKINYEKKVKEYAKYYKYFNSEYTLGSYNKKPLLCSTFSDLTLNNINHVIRNILSAENKCDWLIIIYKYNETNKAELTSIFNHKLAQAREILQRQENYKPIEVYFEFAIERQELLQSVKPWCEKYIRRPMDHPDLLSKPLTDKDWEFLNTFDPCDFSKHEMFNKPITKDAEGDVVAPSFGDSIADDFVYNTILYPKIILFVTYFKYFKSYDYIWSLDDDMSLQDFDMQYFCDILFCSFKGVPIVSQPLIAENTQQYTYLNYQPWTFVQQKEDENHNRVIRSVPSGFIEIQAPLFNSFFLEFYTMAFIVPLLTPTFILGGDWGYDETFCKSAKAWAKMTLDSPYYSGSVNSTIPCALIVDGTPIKHGDHRTADGLIGKDNKFSLNVALVSILTSTFPSYTQAGNAQVSNPIDTKEYVRVYELREGCKA